MLRYCPDCRKKLFVKNGLNLCTDSRCRIRIVDNKIDRVGIEEYSKLQQQYNIPPYHSGNWMLLKENLTGPLIVKNNRQPMDNKKQAYCIVQADSRESAIKEFKKQFTYIKIADEQVVEVDIVELEEL